MYGTAKLKVPGGKLISVKVTYWDKIDSVQILGDFFIYPEESILEIEQSLVGTRATASEQEMSSRLQSFFDGRDITLVGVTAESIAKALKMAMK